MPNKNGKKKLASPSLSFEERMNLAHTRMRQEYPTEMSQANIRPMGPFGKLSGAISQRLTGTQPTAVAGPFGGISYNPASMQGMSQNEIEDVLAHELTHTRQYGEMPFWKRLTEPVIEGTKSVLGLSKTGLPAETEKAYRMMGWDPSYRGSAREMEAFQTETERKIKRGEGFPGYDIYLPPSKKKKAVKAGPSDSKLRELEK